MKATASPTANGGGTATAVAPRSPRKPLAPPQPATLMQAIIQASSDPNIDTGKVRELVALHQQMQEREWQRAFNEAMTACQAELGPVTRNQSNTSTNSRYADLAKLAESALPIIHRHGFSLGFGEVATPKPAHIGVAVRIGHRDGHVERSEFHVPVDVAGFKGTPNKTAIHGWGSALTYCRRYALLCSFNVVVSGDDDGQAAGAKSSAQLKREGVWSQFEADVRATKTIRELEAVREKWRPRAQHWSPGFKQGAQELIGQQTEKLGSTLAQLEESVAEIDHDRERYQAAIAEDSREPNFSQLYSNKPWR